jgi:hypothetical protein
MEDKTSAALTTRPHFVFAMARVQIGCFLENRTAKLPVPCEVAAENRFIDRADPLK